MSAHLKKSNLFLLAIPFTTLLLIVTLLSTTKPPQKQQSNIHITSHFIIQPTTLHKIATSHCNGTLYPQLCASTLQSIPQLATKTIPQIISSTINHTASYVNSTADSCVELLHKYRNIVSHDERQRTALNDCLELFDQTLSDFRKAVSDLQKHPSTSVDDLKTVLSAAITNQYTCLDGFAFVNDSKSLRPLIADDLYNITQLVSNSLAMTRKIPQTKKKRPGEAFEGYGRIVKGFPRWVSAEDRQLLADNVTVADLVVAQDGSGNFTTIMAAVNATPANSKTRFVIYIKAGAYFENVEVSKKLTNIMFVGDGMWKTYIKAGLNVIDGTTTYRSATLAIVGNNFIARDLTVENTAGPAKHQAVAMRSNSDFSAFYRCSFVGYQDTLYTHSFRQFYRECDIYGTVDFIFGDATVVFQKCNMYARKPEDNQKNIFTAQGRDDPGQNTGISIQNCKLAAAAELIPVQSQFKSYLGRPWKNYSRTVVMQSQLDDLIDPAGWLEWDGDFALNTLYYGEYKNRGPGANTTGRVKWPGYRVINSSVEASQFTVGSFIEGDEWLGATSIPFTTGLI